MEPKRKLEVVYNDNSLEFGKAWFFLQSLHVYTTQIGNKWDCWKSSAQIIGRHLVCFVAIRSDYVQECDTRWDEVLLSMSKILSDNILEHSVQIKESWVCATPNRIGIVHYGDSSEKIRSQPWTVENHGDEECRSETSITKLERWARQNWIRSSGQEPKGINPRWRPVFARRPIAKPRIVHKIQNTLPPRLISRPYHEVEVCLGREVSETKLTMVPFFDSFEDIIWKLHVLERLVHIGIRPSANSFKMKPVVRLETSVCFRIARLMNNQKTRKELLP